MKKVIFLMLIVMFAVGMAMAHLPSGWTDILGPHNVDGHGCASCHTPHSGAAGNGGTRTSSPLLWGRDFVQKSYTNLSGDTIDLTSAQTTLTSDSQVLFHTAACLSCHDGSVTIAGMTGNTLEKTADGATPTTYVGKDDLTNDHPVHVAYKPGSTNHNWNGTVDVNGKLTFSDTSAFNTNYGHPARFYGDTTNGGTAWVECSSCHNPHSAVAKGADGNYHVAAFFMRGPYNPTTPGSTSAVQFCRSCHFSKSNENYGVSSPATVY
ncbi:MAG: hypothetical protein ACR2IF_17680 [Terriglobales bacterium]